MIKFPGYVIYYKSANNSTTYTTILEDPECLQMEVDILLEHYGEVTIRRKP